MKSGSASTTAPAGVGASLPTPPVRHHEPCLRTGLIGSTGPWTPFAQSDYGSLPPRSREEARASAATASHVQSSIDEYVLASNSTREAATLGDFADKPLVVLKAGIGSDGAWMTAQDHRTTLSPNSSQRVVVGAAHSTLIHDEEFAAASTQAILDVRSSIREGEPLDR